MTTGASGPAAVGPSTLARVLWTGIRERAWLVVESLLHPDARLVTPPLPDVTLDGRQALDLWRTWAEQGSYAPQPYAFVQVDDRSALVVGLLDRGPDLDQSDAVAATFSDGLLWRSQYYRTVRDFKQSLVADLVLD